MKRTTIMLPDDLKESARKVASQRGVSLGTLIRGALQKEVGAARPKPKAIGIIDSGHTDTAARAGDIKYEPRTWR
jgi:hypothetical protein